MDARTWLQGYSSLRSTRPNHTPPKSATTSRQMTQQMPSDVGETAIPRRVQLAQLLQAAHHDQRRNARILEQSYHALRASTHLLERRWEIYCNELEHELKLPGWRTIAEGSFDVQKAIWYEAINSADQIPCADQEALAEAAIGEHRLKISTRQEPQAGHGDKFPDLFSSSTETYRRLDPRAKPSTPSQSRSSHQRSKADQLPEHQWLPARSTLTESAAVPPATAPTSDSAPTKIHSLRKRQIPNSVPQNHPISSTEGKTPARQASVPTHEQLIHQIEHARQRLSSAKPPPIIIIPPTPPQSPQNTTSPKGPQHSVKIADFTSPNPQSPQGYSQYRPQQANTTGTINFSLPRVQNGATEVNITHKASTPQQATNRHRIEQGSHDLPNRQPSKSGSRAKLTKLHKRRKGDVGSLS